MSEKTGMEQQTTTPTVVESTAQKDADDTVALRKGEYEGLKTQIRQAKKEANELAARLAEFDRAKQAEQADKLKAAEKFGELEKTYQAERDKLAAEVAGLKRSHLVERARNALLAAGMRPGLAIDGAVAALPGEFDADGIADWVGTIKASYPGEFGAPVVQIGAPSVGAVAKAPGDRAVELRQMVAKAKGKGPNVMAAAMREVSAWMAQGHPNPLA